MEFPHGEYLHIASLSLHLQRQEPRALDCTYNRRTPLVVYRRHRKKAQDDRDFSKMRAFEWQDGYGAFTVSRSQIPEVIEYIKSHREHHRKKIFQEEYLELLQKHGVDYDERYLRG